MKLTIACPNLPPSVMPRDSKWLLVFQFELLPHRSRQHHPAAILWDVNESSLHASRTGNFRPIDTDLTVEATE